MKKRYKIELVTMADVAEFARIASEEKGDVKITDGNGLCVNAKSILGVMAAIEWKTLYCESDSEIYEKIERFCVADA